MLSKLPVAKTITVWGGPRNFPIGGTQRYQAWGSSGSFANFWRNDFDLDQNGELVDFRQEFFPAVLFHPMGSWLFAVPPPEIEENMPPDIRALAAFVRLNPLFLWDK